MLDAKLHLDNALSKTLLKHNEIVYRAVYAPKRLILAIIYGP